VKVWKNQETYSLVLKCLAPCTSIHIIVSHKFSHISLILALLSTHLAYRHPIPILTLKSPDYLKRSCCSVVDIRFCTSLW